MVAGSPARFDEAFNTSQEYLLRRVLAQRFYWTINTSKCRNTNAQVHRVFGHYMQLALLSEHAGKAQKVGHEHGPGRCVFLEALASGTDDPKLIRHNMLNVFLAGKDMTASLLNSAFYFLVRNPQVWETLRSEVVGKFGDRCRRGTKSRIRGAPTAPTSPSELPAGPQRDIPAGWRGQARNAPIDIEKGDIVGYNVYVMHWRTDIWGCRRPHVSA
ncbi:hypothetical protein N7462_001698 [Penicillium macrosclerotiorum]|uniref:uncharacterized protein n=1 Tax=Penicillium macrosclerotiorum TaxID=303699 RepID=UPI00254728F9|nr:uncharacterized protein N7462_001698 [Penicillium macrosclerotiorum]KAJ5692275.1 hypothetical protein N7462_001698 [Penicillium macrosclerotiorum]